MKKRTKIGLVITSGVLIILILSVTLIIIKMSQSMKTHPIENINFNELSDGIYTGRFDNEMIKVVLDVTISKNKLTNIEIIKHDNGLGGKAEVIVDDIIKYQSLAVDPISSATYSSHTILKAVENALLEGRTE